MHQCIDYAETLIELFRQHKIVSRQVDVDMVPNGYDGHALVEYYDPFLKEWSAADPTFGLVYFDVVAQRGQSISELNQYVVTQSFASIKPKFLTPYGDFFMRSYYIDPVTLFLNVVPSGKTVAQSAINSPTQFLVPDAGGTQGIHVFEFPGSGSIVINNPSGNFGWEIGNIGLNPVPNTVWSRSIALNAGWSVVTTSPGVQAFTFKRVMF